MDAKKQADDLIARAKGGPFKAVFDPATEAQMNGLTKAFDAIFGPEDYRPPLDKVCPVCHRKHWDHSSMCQSCAGRDEP